MERSFTLDPTMEPREIVTWLLERHKTLPEGAYMHIPMAWREVLTPTEWVDAVGYWPTGSVMEYGVALVRIDSTEMCLERYVPYRKPAS